ncbi:alkaline phosphatase family protein [Solimonas soli]|uniref:alkaline phosphatase family protein n=1 Tax=Solimonas soli TaxID=413479 RepID=UPI0004B5178F|nr:alkaline phosphatase family protein [Solimonas soli]
MDESTRDPRNHSRRRFLAGVAGAAAGASLLGACSSGSDDKGESGYEQAVLPDRPEDIGIDHIVVVMMENRSFDHFLGWVPGADGKQAGLTFKDRDGKPQKTYRLAPDYQGCGLGDPDHSYDGGRVHYDDGKLDGWLLTDPTQVGDVFPIGYYTADDLPFYKGIAAEYTVCDRYFSGILASTYPNRMYMHLGQTDRLSNEFKVSVLPSIWDRLAVAGVSRRYYYRDLPFIALAGGISDTLLISKKYEQFLADAAAGELPSVCFVDPKFNVESPDGTSEDDHPQADIRLGQAWLNQIYEALRNSPNWEKTLLIINYDEWGGFFDHVPPPIAPVSDREAALGNDGRLGFRVPCMLIGPRARRGYVSHLPLDPNSILNFIAWRFGFEPLGVRGASSLNIAYALDLDNTPRGDAPAFAVPAGPTDPLCSTDTSTAAGKALHELDPVTRARVEHQRENEALAAFARSLGFPV